MSKYIDLISLLSEQDKYLITKYIGAFGCNEEKFIGVDQWLQDWSHANQRLYKLLGNSFIYEFPYEYEKTRGILRKELSDLLYDSSFEKDFNEFLYQIIDKKYYNSDVRDTDLGMNRIQRSFLRGVLYVDNFIDNKITDTFKFKKPDAKKMLQIQAGAKPMRAITQIMDYFGNEYDFDKAAFEDFRKKHAILFSEKTIKGTICISIHPLDYMTMSDNASNWTSCMSWKTDGCYHVGTIEMMNSNNTLCCYLKDKSVFQFGEDEETGEVYLWNNKRWRQLLYITKDILMCGKPYPYASESLSKGILDHIKKLAEDNLNWTYEFGPEFYQDMAHIHGTYRMEKQRNWMRAKSYIKHNILWDTRGMYNDMLNDPNTSYWCYRNKVDHTKIISTSGKATCICCGGDILYSNDEYEYNERWAECGSVICSECMSDKFSCDFCGERDRFAKRYTLPDGREICENCANDRLFFCPDCGKASYIFDSLPKVGNHPNLYKFLTDNNLKEYICRYPIHNINVSYGNWSKNEIDEYMNRPINTNNDDEDENVIYIEKLYACNKCGNKIIPDTTFKVASFWSSYNREEGLLNPMHAHRYRYYNLKKASLEDFAAQIERDMSCDKRTAT